MKKVKKLQIVLRLINDIKLVLFRVEDEDIKEKLLGWLKGNGDPDIEKDPDKNDYTITLHNVIIIGAEVDVYLGLAGGLGYFELEITADGKKLTDPAISGQLGHKGTVTYEGHLTL